MWRVLIVEDDQDKGDQIARFLRGLMPDVAIETARSYRSGVTAALKPGWQVILLDVTMPTFDTSSEEDGGRPQVYAGLEILRQMRRAAVNTPVVVVTQFDQFGDGDDALTLAQVEDRLRQTHPDSYQGAVYYSAVFSDWQELLKERILEILSQNGGGL